jgi:hypothetical protein
MSLKGHERRMKASAPAAGRPRPADPTGGQGGFRLGPLPNKTVASIQAPSAQEEEQARRNAVTDGG